MRESEHARSQQLTRRKDVMYVVDLSTAKKPRVGSSVAPELRSLHAREITEDKPDEHGAHFSAMQEGEEHLRNMCSGTG